MPSANEEQISRNTRHDDIGNPFVSFRRFADEQMSSLMRTITGQPQKSTEPTPSASDEDLPWIIQAMTDDQRRRLPSMWDQSRREAMDQKRQELYGVPTDQFRQEYQETSQKLNDEVARCPYRPQNQEVPERNRREHPYDLSPKYCCDGGFPADPHDFEVDYSAPVPWVIHYLDHSPYSPQQLETDELFRQRGRQWRDAFEDLLAIQNGLPLPDEVSVRRNKCNAHWVQAMLDDGLLDRSRKVVRKDQESSFARDELDKAFQAVCAMIGYPGKDRKESSNYHRKEQDEDEDYHDDNGDENDEGDDNDDDDDDENNEDEELTELDWYERMICPDRGLFTERLNAVFSDAFRNESQQSNTTSFFAAKHETGSGKPGIVSTLITTERTTQPDGSVITKMVLKKRFADGREESTETTHTTNGQHEEKPKLTVEPEAEKSKVGKKGDEVEEPRSSGWFWS